MKNKNKKICLVTGASSGIGKEIAVGLASLDNRVIIVCRNAEKGELALEEIKDRSGSTSIDLLTADMSSQAEIRSLAKTIYDRYSALHILINNAGVVLSKKMLSLDGIEMTLATNHLGPFLLTNLLLDLLKKDTPARIINISSAIHKWGAIDLEDLQYEHKKYQFMKAYAQSKLLMNITSFELASRLIGTDITVNCVHPGAVKTNLGSNSAHSITVKLIDMAIKLLFISPKRAAKPIVDLAMSSKFTNVTGRFFMKGKLAPSKRTAFDPIQTERVWGISEDLIGLYPKSPGPYESS